MWLPYGLLLFAFTLTLGGLALLVDAARRTLRASRATERIRRG